MIEQRSDPESSVDVSLDLDPPRVEEFLRVRLTLSQVQQVSIGWREVGEGGDVSEVAH